MERSHELLFPHTTCLTKASCNAVCSEASMQHVCIIRNYASLYIQMSISYQDHFDSTSSRLHTRMRGRSNEIGKLGKCWQGYQTVRTCKSAGNYSRAQRQI